jgi:hypothetical protein
MDPKEIRCDLWTGVLLLGIGANGGPSEHGNEPSEFRKRRGISWPPELLLASYEGLYSSELVTVPGSSLDCCLSLDV